MALSTPTSHLCILLPVASTHALIVLLLLSIVTGLVMIVLFGYLSDQKAVRVAKDQLRAQLLAVRLFQDQPQVVLRAYGRILTGTGRYLRVSFKPLAVIILPMIALLIYGDRYLGSLPFQTNQPILLKARLDKPDSLDNVSLRLPPGLAESAPAVHIADGNEVDWRLVASAEGNYEVNVLTGGQELGKQVVVSNNLTHLSECRLRGHFWQRLLDCAEPALPANAAVRLLAVNYPARDIDLGPWATNWLVVFFVVSLAAALLFKFILGIEI
jgi:type II secretory pathway pseudopilin PulG